MCIFNGSAHIVVQLYANITLWFLWLLKYPHHKHRQIYCTLEHLVLIFLLPKGQGFILTGRGRAGCSVTGPSVSWRTTAVVASIVWWGWVTLSGAGSGATITCDTTATPWCPFSPDAVNYRSKQPNFIVLYHEMNWSNRKYVQRKTSLGP